MGRTALMFLVVSGLVARAQSQSAAKPAITAADYLLLQRVADPQIAPSGKRIVFERSQVDTAQDRWATMLWMVNADGAGARPFTRGREARWSPDGQQIAYLAPGADNKVPQIFVRASDGSGTPRQLTDLPDAPQNIAWSPDGQRIGFVRRIPDRRPELTVEMPTAPVGAQWAAPPRQIDKVHDRLDGVGIFDTGFLHLFVVSANGGPVAPITNGPYTAGGVFDGMAFGVKWSWLNDSRTIVFDGYREGDVDRDIQDMNIYRVSIDGGTPVRLTKDRGTWANPVISPDGTKIAFLGHPADGYIMTSSDLYVINIDGSGRRRIGHGIYWNPVIAADQTLLWARTSQGVYFAPVAKGTRHLLFAPLDGSGPRALTTDASVLDITSIATDGTIAALFSTWDGPPDVALVKPVGNAARIKAITKVNAGWLDGRSLARVEEIWFHSKDGPPVQGWLVKPPDFDPRRKYPLLLEVHGGPQIMYTSAFSMPWQVYAGRGYVVLYLNPRGSTGYGDDFLHAVERNNYPGPDYDDLMAGVDATLARGYVNPTRLYISGCSGGGTLSAWAIGHTDRFAAASVRCMVADWVTMAGTSDFPYLADGFFTAPYWEDPSAWRDRSPLSYVGKVNTPTLVVNGGRDQRTPALMATAFYRALKLRGVPARLILFDEESHGNPNSARPSNWVRSVLLTLKWFDIYQPGQPTPKAP